MLNDYTTNKHDNILTYSPGIDLIATTTTNK